MGPGSHVVLVPDVTPFGEVARSQMCFGSGSGPPTKSIKLRPVTRIMPRGLCKDWPAGTAGGRRGAVQEPGI